MLALLAELEALAAAVLCTVGINLNSVITNSDSSRTGPTRETPIITRHAATGLVFRFTAASRAVAPIEAFIIVVVSTTVPYEVHYFSENFGVRQFPTINYIIPYSRGILHEFLFFYKVVFSFVADT